MSHAVLSICGVGTPLIGALELRGRRVLVENKAAASYGSSTEEPTVEVKRC